MPSDLIFWPLSRNVGPKQHHGDPYRDADYPCVGVCMTDPESGYYVDAVAPLTASPLERPSSVVTRAETEPVGPEPGADRQHEKNAVV